MKTRQQVEKLKTDWIEDPVWDIFDTEGYESYREELESFQAEWEEKWKMEREKDLRERAERLGIPGRLSLANYKDKLEYIKSVVWKEG